MRFPWARDQNRRQTERGRKQGRLSGSGQRSLRIEPLEQRALLAITWTGEAGDFLWSTPENWFSDAVQGPALPGPDDDVIIGDIGNNSILVTQPNESIASLASDAELVFDNGVSTFVIGDLAGAPADFGLSLDFGFFGSVAVTSRNASFDYESQNPIPINSSGEAVVEGATLRGEGGTIELFGTGPLGDILGRGTTFWDGLIFEHSTSEPAKVEILEDQLKINIPFTALSDLEEELGFQVSVSAEGEFVAFADLTPGYEPSDVTQLSGEYEFQIDPVMSSLTVDIPLVLSSSGLSSPQEPGSDVVNFTGFFKTRFDSGAIEFPGGSEINAVLKPGNFEPLLDAERDVVHVAIGGSLQGNAAVDRAVYSEGTLDPGRTDLGLPFGQINIDGDYTQTDLGLLEIEIGGDTPGVSFDSLVVSGDVTLDGRLRISVADGFEVELDDTFDIITANSVTGTFANLQGLRLDSGLFLRPDYHDHGVTLIAVPAGIDVIAAPNLTTTEDGGTANFQVVLNAEPTDDVTVRVSSLGIGEGTVSPAVLTFTRDNYFEEQTVTITGLDDGTGEAFADGDQTYVIQLAPAESEDPAYDGYDPEDVTVINIDNDGDQPPTLEFIGPQTIDEGVELRFTVVANDPDSEPDALVFSIDDNYPDGATINQETREFSWTPSEGQGPETYMVVVRVRDETGGEAFEVVRIDVGEVNQDPVLGFIGDQNVDEGEELQFVAMATDLDLPIQSLTYTLDSGAPEGATIHPETGVFSWMPGSQVDPGTYPVTVRVSDGMGGEDFELIQITVHEVIVEPELTVTLPSPEVREDAVNPAMRGTVTRGGDLSGPLTVFLVSSDTTEIVLPVQVTFPANVASVQFDVEVVQDFFLDGNRSVQVSATATGYQSGSTTITVVDVEVPPLVLTLNDASITEDGSTIATISRGVASPGALVVGIYSNGSGQLSLPTQVTIAANESEATFAVTPINDDLLEMTRVFYITASAPNYVGSSATLELVDDDTPVITLAVDRDTISESEGTTAATATITRDRVTDKPLTVSLTNSNPADIHIPTRVVIPAGEAAVTFSIAVNDNALVDGPRVATIFAQVRTTVSELPVPGSLATVLVQIADDDGPTLSVTALQDIVAEGSSGTVRVRRNTPTDTALDVTLASSDTTELTIASEVTIPIGSSFVDVPFSALDDLQTDGNQGVFVSASATDFTGGQDRVLVTDEDLPDLVVTQFELPSEVLAGEIFDFTYTVQNNGLIPAIADGDDSWTDYVFLSDDPFIGGDFLIDTFSFDGPIGVSQASESPIRSVVAPLPSGNYWVVVRTDATGDVAELLEDNNYAISSQPISVVPAYVASVGVDLDQAPAGTVVTISGQLTRNDGSSDPVANAPADISIVLSGSTRVIRTVSDINGMYSATFKPPLGLGGTYRITAAPPGEASTADPVSLLIYDLQPSLAAPISMLIGDPATTREVTIHNLTDVPLTGLTAELVNSPSQLDVTLELSADNLAASGSGVLGITVAGNEVLEPGQRIEIQLTTNEGATRTVFVDVAVNPLTAKLTIIADQLVASMLTDTQTVVSFEIVNDGIAPSGNLLVNLDAVAAFSWFKLAGPSVVPSLDPGESAVVSLLLTPGDTVPLALFSGSFEITPFDDSLSSVLVQFSFRHVTDDMASVTVSVVDEYTFNDISEPKVEGAQVLLIDPYTGDVRSSGTTTASGEVTFADIEAGPYVVEVRAANHSAARTTINLQAGDDAQLEAFLSLQTVQYIWTVEEVEVEDRTRITIQSVFQSSVPAPVVVIEPTAIDLGELTVVGQQMTVDLRISNEGQVDVFDVVVQLPSHPLYEFTLPNTFIGVLEAGTSVTVPLTIELLPGSTGPRVLVGSVDYSYQAGPYQPRHTTDIVFYNVAGDEPQPVPTRLLPRSGSSGGGFGGGGGGGGTFSGTFSTGGGTVHVWAIPNNAFAPSPDIEVSLQIDQEAVLTRTAFDAGLQLINDSTDMPIEDLLVEVIILDENNNIVNDLFGIYEPLLVNVLAVDGTGTVETQTTASATWRILPSDEAAPLVATQYFVGGRLKYTHGGANIEIQLEPVAITVEPDAALDIKYFHQRDVYSDDPITTEVVEPSEPFSLGVMVQNRGTGTARNLTITSARPIIVSNDDGAIVDFSIVSAEVAGSPTKASLDVNFGDVGPGEIVVGQWLLEASQQGYFTDYEATFEHLAPFGDPRLSIIKSVEIHELVRRVRADGPAADGLPDFLTNDVPDATRQYPDTLHLSDGSVVSVGLATNASVDSAPTPSDLDFALTLDAAAGWTFLQIDDPTAGAFGLLRIVRSDGSEVPVENYWVTDRTFIAGEDQPRYENKLHLLDFNSTGSYTVFVEADEVSDTLIVTNTQASGPGSLAAALTTANTMEGDVEIHFNIPATDPNFNGTVFLVQTDSLPTLDNPDVTVTLVGASQEAFGGDTNPGGPDVLIGFGGEDPLSVVGSTLVIDGIAADTFRLSALSGGRIDVQNVSELFGAVLTAEGGGEINLGAEITEITTILGTASNLGQINFEADTVTFGNATILASALGRINAINVVLTDQLSVLSAADGGAINIALSLEMSGGTVNAASDGQILIGDIQSAPADFALQAIDGGIELYAASRNSQYDYTSVGPLPIDENGQFVITDTLVSGLAGTYEVSIGGDSILEETWAGFRFDNDSLELASIEIVGDRLQLTAPFDSDGDVGLPGVTLRGTGRFVAYAELPSGSTIDDVRELAGKFDFYIDPVQSFVDVSGDIDGVPFTPQAIGSDHMTFTGFYRASFANGSITFPGGSRVTTTQIEGVFLPGVESQPANIHIAPGGRVSGSGFIVGDVFNDGVIVPGAFSIDGDFTQSDLGATEVLLSGTVPGPEPGTQLARLDISGTATLDGDLRIRPTEMLDASSGDQYLMMNFGSVAGEFLDISGLRLDNGIFLKPVFGETSLTLDAIAPAIIISEPSDGLITSEDGTQATFTLQLAVEPEVPVTIDLLSLASDEGMFSPASVTFFPGDPEPIKTVTITGLDDADFDGDQVYSILLSVANESDPAYVGLQSDPVVVTNLDDDVPLVVTTALDIVDPEDDLLSLREAINIANEDDSFNAIHFAIDTGIQTIALTSALPEILYPVIIDGWSQPGFEGTPMIELDGSEAGLNVSGLVLRDHTGSIVRGLVINRFGVDATINETGYGILVEGGGFHHIAGNYIGTDITGTEGLGNDSDGILLRNTSSNIVGTDGDGEFDELERNVLSGNGETGIELSGASNNVVAGNLIGTDVSGTSAIPNVGFAGLRIADGASANLIGTNSDGVSDDLERNVISGNGVVSGERGFGIMVVGAETDENTIAGNFIGTDITGTLVLGNTLDGIHLSAGATQTLIGGLNPAARNVISANDRAGIRVRDAGTQNTVVQGNYIGTDVTGNVGLGNGSDGILISDGATASLIGGSSSAARNVIAANTTMDNNAAGIRVRGEGTTGHVIQGNFVGTNAAGTASLGNANQGIYILNTTVITVGTDGDGFGDATEGNLISGNGRFGLLIEGSSDNVVAGNFIGTNRDRAGNLGNGTLAEPHSGIRIRAGATNTIVGGAGELANVIAFNMGAGVELAGDLSLGNRIAENSFFGNGGLAIDLLNDGPTANDAGDTDVGPNGLQNFPIIESFTSGATTRILGRFNSSPSTVFTLDFYASAAADPSGYGEGERYLGSAIVTTDEGGHLNFDITLEVTTSDDEFITATATDPEGNTSEFGGMNDRPFVANPIEDVIDDLTTAGRTIDLSDVFDDLDLLFDPDVLAIAVVGNTDTELVATSLEGSTLTLDYSEGLSGQAEITLRATDLAGEFVEHTFLVTINAENESPVLDPIGNRTVDEGNELRFTATASDADVPSNTLVFTLDSGAPEGAAIDPISGVFTWTPTEEQGPGVFPVTIRVSDSVGGEDFETIEIIVNEVNASPILDPIGDQTVAEGNELRFTVSAGDADVPSTSLLYSLDPGAPEGAAIDPLSGVFTWSPSEDQGPGVYPVTIRVSDTAGGDDFKIIEITVDEANTDPILDPIGDQTVDEGVELRFTAQATDIDLPEQELVFSLDPGAPDGAAIGPASGVFTWTPFEEQGPGTYEVTIRVIDQAGGEDFETIQIVVAEVGQAPVIDPIDPQSAEVGHVLSFDVTAFDLDEPSTSDLSYRFISEVPDGAEIDSETGRFIWTPNETHAGQTFEFTIEVSDQGDPPLTSTQSFTVSVEEPAANQPPVVVFPFEELSPVKVGELLRFDVMATDPDGQAPDVVFSLAPGAPAGATIDPSSGEFNWTPGEDSAGETFEITVRATDRGQPPMTTEKSFLIAVDEIPMNQPPLLQPIGPQTAAEGEALVFTASAVDGDHPSPELTFLLGSGAPRGAFIDPVTGLFTWVPTEEQGGETFVIEVLVRDPDGATDVEAVSVSVAEVNSPPQISVIAPQRIPENSSLTFEIEVIDPDAPTQELSFVFEGELPGEWTFDQESRLFSWYPQRGGPLGDYPFTLTVVDEMGAQTSRTFELSVADAVDGQLQSVVFDDQNANGVRDVGEPGISGVQASLLRDSDLDGTFETLFSSGATNELGEIYFNNLPRGMYQMTLDTPSLPLGFTLLSSTSSAPVEVRSGRGFIDGGFRIANVFVVAFVPPDASSQVPTEGTAELVSSGTSSRGPEDDEILPVSYNKQSEELKVAGPSGTSSSSGAGESSAEVQIVQAMRFGGGEAIGDVSDVVQTSGAPSALPSVAADEVIGDVLSLSDDISASLFILPSAVEADTPPASELLGSIVGVLFEDLDRNGNFDISFERGIPNQRVFLDTNANGKLDAGEPSVLSDGEGRFTFSDLEPGNYNVVSELGDAWQYAPSTQEALAVVLQPGQPELRDINFALYAQEDIETAEPSHTPWLWWVSGAVGLLTAGLGTWIIKRRRNQKGEADYWHSKRSANPGSEQAEGHQDTESDLSTTRAGTVREIPTRESKP